VFFINAKEQIGNVSNLLFANPYPAYVLLDFTNYFWHLYRFNGLWINSKVSVATFKKITELIPVTENFEYEAPFNILSFRFVLQSNGNDQTVNVTGPLFNTEIRTLLDHAKPGDVINIDNIIVVGPDLVKRKLDGLTIKVI